MAVTRDWVPKQIDKFKIFADNLCERVGDNFEDWHLDADEVAALLMWQIVFNGYYKISSIKNTHSTEDTENTKAARKTYQKELRTMGIGRIKTNRFMTNVDKLACGLNIDSDSYRLSSIAKISPLIAFKNKGSMGGKIVCINPNTYKICKPDGQDGIKITFAFYKLGKRMPKEASGTFTIYLTKCNGKVVFPENKLGMPFVGFARYFNTRGILGTIATRFEGMVC